MCPITATQNSPIPAEPSERMGRFPKQFVYLAIGLVQGLALALALSLNESETVYPVLFFPLLMTALLLPLVFYCSQAAELRRRLWILALTAVAILAIGIYQGVTIGANPKSGLFDNSISLSFTLALAIFVGIPALCVRAATWEERYRQWVATALQTFGALVQAGLVLGLCWAVIASSVFLFELLGAKELENLVFSRYSFVITSSLVVALVVARTRRDDSIMHAIFTRLMQLCAWIYPVIAVVGILFVASWIAGIEKLLETHQAATILLWFIALLIFFFNLHNRCGTEERDKKWLRVLTAFCWLAALPMLLVALYGLGVRIEAHGLTPDRIWGLFTASIIAIFVFGYAAHSVLGLRQVQGGKRLISRTHLAATLVLVAGILLMQVGIADPRWISVSSQLHRLELLGKDVIFDEEESLTNSADDILDFLGWESGVYGENALRELAARTDSSNDKIIAKSAKLALDGLRSYERRHPEDYRLRSDPDPESVANALRSLKVFPDGEALPPELVEELASRSYTLPVACLTPQGAEPACIFWKVRFEKNGVESYIPLAKNDRPFGRGYSGSIWQKHGKGYWALVGQLEAGCPNACPNAQDTLFAAVLANSVQLVPPQNPRNEILAGGIRIIPPPPSESDISTPGCTC